MKFKIPQFKLEDFESYIINLNKKAVKFNQQEISYNIISHKDVKHEYKYGSFNYTQLEVELKGCVPRINGFEIIAYIVHAIEKYVFPFSDEYTDDYKDENRRCDHCDRKIKRKYIYILKNSKTGEKIQVGKTCINDFVGANINSYITSLNAFREHVEGYSDESPQRDNLLNTELLLAYCISLINQFGYTKADCDNSTKINAIKAYSEGFEINKEAVELAKKVKKYFKDEYKSSGDFGNNLISSCSNNFINPKFAGVLAYVYVEYKKELEAKNKAENSKFFGERNKRYTSNLTFIRSNSFEGYYGCVFFTTFSDDSGNTIVWKSKNGIYDLTGDNCDEAVNKTYNVKFTVKDHTTYNEVKQTNILRAKLA